MFENDIFVLFYCGLINGFFADLVLNYQLLFSLKNWVQVQFYCNIFSQKVEFCNNISQNVLQCLFTKSRKYKNPSILLNM